MGRILPAGEPMVDYPKTMSNQGNSSLERRLDGWKQIAGHLGVDERTARRWFHENSLPVGRVGKRVFALSQQLDTWRAARTTEPRSSTSSPPQPEESGTPPTNRVDEFTDRTMPRSGARGSDVETEESPAPLPPVRDESEALLPGSGLKPKRLPRQKIVATVSIAASFVLLAWAAIVLSRLSWQYSVRSSAPVGRLLVRGTSEGSAPKRYFLSAGAAFLAITPDGRKLFAGSGTASVISVLQPFVGRQDTVSVGSGLNSIRVSPDGKYLYAASRVDGVIVLDVESGRVIRHYSTAGEVFDLAVSPDGRKLFLAMSYRGLWRILADGTDLKQISPQTCPEFLSIGPPNRLYVSFQCGGAIGRSGHDTVEAYDTESERRITRATGPPLVGSRLAASPDGDELSMDSGDACAVPQYDHQGCPPGASAMLHLLDLTDYRFTDSIQIEFPMQVARYVDRNRLLLMGRRLSVMDTYRRAEVEGLTVEDPSPQGSGVSAIALDSTSNRMYVALDRVPEILGFRADPVGCSSDEPGLVSFYPGDGNATDVIGGESLRPIGPLKFVPGHVGQAFRFDGKSAYLRGPTTSHHQLGQGDSSIVFYVKFSQTAGEMTLFHHQSSHALSSVRISKTRDERIAFELQTPRTVVHLQSQALVAPGQWYSVAVTKHDRQVTLYLDGQTQDSLRRQQDTIEINTTGPTTFGASVDLVQYLDGKLDEIRQYNRALTPEEVRNLYEMREKGPCAITVPSAARASYKASSLLALPN